MSMKLLPQFIRSTRGAVGLVFVLVPLTIAFLGPVISNRDPESARLLPGSAAGTGLPLGADALGRDVLARYLDGGMSVVLVSLAATALACVCGGLVGLTAGYSETLLHPIMMRGVDLMLAFPGLIVLLLVVNALGGSELVLLLGVALIQAPQIARITYGAIVVAKHTAYVEAAVARGERSLNVVTREILPNIAPILLVDFGLRLGQSVLLVASVNFLGLGIQPPKSDWGLMISENRIVIGTNPLATLIPAATLGLLLVGVSLLCDTYSESIGRVSSPRRGSRRLQALRAQVHAKNPT